MHRELHVALVYVRSLLVMRSPRSGFTPEKATPSLLLSLLTTGVVVVRLTPAFEVDPRWKGGIATKYAAFPLDPTAGGSS